MLDGCAFGQAHGLIKATGEINHLVGERLGPCILLFLGNALGRVKIGLGHRRHPERHAQLVQAIAKARHHRGAQHAMSQMSSPEQGARASLAKCQMACGHVAHLI